MTFFLSNIALTDNCVFLFCPQKLFNFFLGLAGQPAKLSWRSSTARKPCLRSRCLRLRDPGLPQASHLPAAAAAAASARAASPTIFALFDASASPFFLFFPFFPFFLFPFSFHLKVALQNLHQNEYPNTLAFTKCPFIQRYLGKCLCISPKSNQMGPICVKNQNYILGSALDCSFSLCDVCSQKTSLFVDIYMVAVFMAPEATLIAKS